MDHVEKAFGPWNPGLLSQVPTEWRPLATIFRPENVYSSFDAAEELRGLTGFALSELVLFRPERLALHELLIRVTADFAVPDGSRIEDLGINFRRIASRILTHYLDPRMGDITRAFEDARRQTTEAVDAALSTVTGKNGAGAAARPRAARLWGLIAQRHAPASSAASDYRWGPDEIADCEHSSHQARDPMSKIAYQTLGRVLSGLFATHGHAWGTRDLIVRLAGGIAANVIGSDAIGRAIEPHLRCAAIEEGFGLLPRQDRPIVINTKGASASGKSTLRPLQKTLAGAIGANWSDFALISPDIWRKQLLDYAALGEAFKYAGAFTAEEVQIVDRKLDRYMAEKFASGNMSHLLIDRFRFDSFAPDSDQEGSNLLTRFGRTLYLFFVITPPELLVERAWKRGLEFGRYKAVDDTLAHSVEAYTGIPNVFFTWVRRSDKLIRFEFLDNTVPMGSRPRTVAFGDNDMMNVLSVKGMLDIVRFGRIYVDATAPELLYRDRRLLAGGHNLSFLKRCLEEFRHVNFACQASGRIYLRIESGVPVSIDPDALRSAIVDTDTRIALQALAGSALAAGFAAAQRPRYLRRYDGNEAQRADAVPTLGEWGDSPDAVPPMSC